MPLHMACQWGQPACVAVLLKHGAYPLDVDHRLRTALECAEASTRTLEEQTVDEMTPFNNPCRITKVGLEQVIVLLARHTVRH